MIAIITNTNIDQNNAKVLAKSRARAQAASDAYAVAVANMSAK